MNKRKKEEKYPFRFLRIVFQSIGYFLKIPMLFACYILLAGIVARPLHGYSVVLGLPYGFSGAGKDSVVFGKWLLITGIPIMVNGLMLRRGSGINAQVKIRLKKKHKYCQMLALECIWLNTIWAILLTSFLVVEQGWGNALKAFLLLQSNIVLWESIQISLFYRKPAGVSESSSGWITIGLNGASCLIGLHITSLYKFLPSFWGMFCRSCIENSIKSYCMMLVLNVVISMLLLVLLHEEE